jgi:hypothetical protein
MGVMNMQMQVRLEIDPGEVDLARFSRPITVTMAAFLRHCLSHPICVPDRERPYQDGV